MVVSYYPRYEKGCTGKKNELLSNFVRPYKVGDKTLVISDNGAWAVLDNQQYKKVTSGELKKDDALFKDLESRGVIWTSGNVSDVARDYKRRKQFLFQGTSLHIVIPTFRCNHKCLYCHSNARPEEKDGFDMDEETAKKVVDFIMQSTSDYIKIEFQGGEPLLNFPIIKVIIEYATKKAEEKEKVLSFDIVTNFSLMDDEKMKYLIKRDVGLCTSLDGPKELHNKNRVLAYGKTKDSHAKVEYWIRKVKEEYKYEKINALMVITKHSLPLWKEIVDEYVRLGLDRIWFGFVNPLGNAQSNWDKIGYTAEEYVDFWGKALDYIIKSDIDIREMSASIMMKKILTKSDPMYVDLQSPCGAVIGQMAYDHKGDIYTCDEGKMYEEFKLGNVGTHSYKDILTSPKACTMVASSTNDTTACDSCAWKPYCGLCPVCNFASQGNIISKLPEDYRCKILKGQFRYLFDRLLSDKRYLNVFSKWAERKVF